MKRFVLLLSITALLLGASAIAATPDAASSLGKDIRSKVLPNGMKIIVWPDHDIPNVVIYDWFHVGSRNEVTGITGLSHFFEHMMFNGAKKYGPGEFDRVMEAAGGSNNAFTSENVTVYEDWFPKSALRTIFDLEADRIQNLAFDPKMIDSERGVVYSERRSSVDNNNFGLLSEQVQSTAFLAHPYHNPVIGWPSDIESWTREDLVRYFRTYYAPNNATMIVTGDVTPDEIFSLAEQYLGPIPRHDPPPPIRTKEPAQKGERRVEITKAAQVPILQMAWHIGNATDADLPAVNLLLSILTEGDSSRLYRRLVDQERQALRVDAYADEGFDPGLAWMMVTLSADGNLDRTEKIIDEEIARIAHDGPTPAEVTKVKNMFLAQFWGGLETINGKARALGEYEVFHGDYHQLFSAPATYEAVTAEQIRDVAAKYFTPTNRTVGQLVPAAGNAPEASR
ncbi:MAG: pitrilysin family protein [Thermoanaerobaculia bacterium]